MRHKGGNMSRKYIGNINIKNNSLYDESIGSDKGNNGKKNMQKTVWSCFFATVATFSVALSVYFGLMCKKTQNAQLTSDEYYKNQSINNCRRSMFNISDGLQNADANIGKLLVSKSKSFSTKTLIETEGVAQSSVADLSYLPIERNISISCAKYFNQLGDYCKALSKSIEDKGTLSDEQKDSLKELRKVGQKLKKSIDLTIHNDDAFVWGVNDGEYTFELKLDDIDENTFDYPQLVYDGPFSDSITERTFDRQKLPISKVKNILQEKFKDYSVSDIEFIAEVDNRASVYYFVLKLNGEDYSVTTATDGTVAELNKNGKQNSDEELEHATMSSTNEESNQNNLETHCCEVAENMAKSLGYEVETMWVSEPIDGRVYVNMISRQNNINIYPDMVKMAVDAKTCQVVGLDAFGYIANHRSRQLPQKYITSQEASLKIANELKVETSNLCIVPDGNSEVFCYEIKVNNDTEKFLIYIDAITGEEVDILKIIEDKMGYTVM